MRDRSAFTLIELLVVVAVVAMLSALLLPVFSSLRESSRRAACASRFHQAQLAAMLYVGDWDDTFPIVSHQPGPVSDPERDRTWVQNLIPYGLSLGLWRCPAAPPSSSEPPTAFDPDLTPGDLAYRFHEASKGAHLGYNYLYLSPVLAEGESWIPLPRSLSAVGSPSNVLLFVDSAADRAMPPSSGSWLVLPPCRYSVGRSGAYDTFLLGGRPVFAPLPGWTPLNARSAWFGGAWPWHGRLATTVTLDGSVSARTMADLAKGCEVRPNWGGWVRMGAPYAWDLD
ncbi:MAG: prepilin-type N-terminal cleavage/methylation domain-containing protein [Fimbriimonadales bacterium]|nr:prepilin-type N-terminal cleavage/methylation domain-containing protein [Fimbriimonadales bacterium]